MNHKLKDEKDTSTLPMNNNLVDRECYNRQVDYQPLDSYYKRTAISAIEQEPTPEDRPPRPRQRP